MRFNFSLHYLFEIILFILFRNFLPRNSMFCYFFFIWFYLQTIALTELLFVYNFRTLSVLLCLLSRRAKITDLLCVVSLLVSFCCVFTTCYFLVLLLFRLLPLFRRFLTIAMTFCCCCFKSSFRLNV